MKKTKQLFKRKCKWCNKSFKTTNNLKQYCSGSTSCRRHFNEKKMSLKEYKIQMRRKPCTQCSKLFKPKTLKSHLCSQTCTKIFQRNNAKRISQEYIFNYLTETSCKSCGTKDIRVLEFDHVNPKTKKFEIGQAVRDGVKLVKIKREINKCQVLCSNCHRIKTFKERGIIRFSLYLDSLEE